MSSDPKASSSPIAQSTPPSLTMAARRSSIFCSLGWTVKSCGSETCASPTALSTSVVMAVLADSRGRWSTGRTCLEESWASWVSAKARSSCPR